MESQNSVLLEHLRAHGSITSMEAFTLYGCTRLSARIYELRKMGYVIDSVDRISKNRFGRPVRYSEYVLKREQRV